MNYIYLFKENGNCFQRSTFSTGGVDMAEYARMNNASAYVESDENLDIEHLKLIDGQMTIVETVNLEKLTAEATGKRNILLVESDWTDTFSSKTRLGDDLYNAWQAYRQALRDLTKQEGFPQNVVWPTKPE